MAFPEGFRSVSGADFFISIGNKDCRVYPRLKVLSRFGSNLRVVVPELARRYWEVASINRSISWRKAAVTFFTYPLVTALDFKRGDSGLYQIGDRAQQVQIL